MREFFSSRMPGYLPEKITRKRRKDLFFLPAEIIFLFQINRRKQAAWI